MTNSKFFSHVNTHKKGGALLFVTQTTIFSEFYKLTHIIIIGRKGLNPFYVDPFDFSIVILHMVGQERILLVSISDEFSNFWLNGDSKCNTSIYI